MSPSFELRWLLTSPYPQSAGRLQYRYLEQCLGVEDGGFRWTDWADVPHVIVKPTENPDGQ